MAASVVRPPKEREPIRITLVSTGLLLVLASDACKAQMADRSQTADWRVISVSAWVEKDFMGGAPHPKGGQTGRLVGAYHVSDKSALFVEVAFPALRAFPAALAAFKISLSDMNVTSRINAWRINKPWDIRDRQRGVELAGCGRRGGN